MKTIALAALLAGAGVAHAAEQPSARELFRQMDTNRDRTLQFEEIRAARAKLFDRIDANRNGIVDPGELQNAAAGKADGGRRMVQAGEMADRRQRMDTNADGNISREEFVAFIPDRLFNADADGSRSLSLTELRTLRGK